MLEKKEARDFFEFLISKKSNSVLTSKLKNQVKDAKHNTQWRMQAYAFHDGQEEGIQIGTEQGIKEGILQKAIEDAENFLRENIAQEIIARCTGLPLEKVKEIAD